MTEEKRDPSIVTDDRIIDPRTEFYFYIPDGNPNGEDSFTLPLGVRPVHYNNNEYNSFYIGSVKTPYKVANWTGQTSIPNSPTTSIGYWGRDHGDNSGIPPDNDKRTVGGLYPIGGKYDSEFKTVQNSGTDGAKGAGIMPILLSSYVHFMLAENILTSGVIGDAKVELLLAVDQSIDKSIKKINEYPKIDNITIRNPLVNPITNIAYAQGTYLPGTVVTNTLGSVNASILYSYTDFNTIDIRYRNEYKSFISKIYDGLNPSKKLELIVKEYFIASWGNGIEPYNNYRRTGYPTNLQPTLEVTSGEYFYTALYPTSAANNNPNTPFNSRTRKVFWDKANLTLH